MFCEGKTGPPASETDLRRWFRSADGSCLTFGSRPTPRTAKSHRAKPSLTLLLVLGCTAPNSDYSVGAGGADGAVDQRAEATPGVGGAGGTAGDPGAGGGGGMIPGYGGQGGFFPGTGGTVPGYGGNGGTAGNDAAVPGGDASVADAPADPDVASPMPDVAPPVDLAPPPPDLAPPPPDLAPDLPPPDVQPRDASPLDGAMTDATGAPLPGLNVYYFNDKNQSQLFRGPVYENANIDVNWRGEAPLLGMSSDNFAVVWTGVLVPTQTAAYTFYTYSDDGARITLDGAHILDHYSTQMLSEWPSQVVMLYAYRRYPLRVEFFDGQYTARITVSWSAAGVGIAKQPIPRSFLFTH